MQLFEHSTSPESLKARYHQLAKVYHPDMGGSDQLMQIINQAYQAALSKISGLRKSLYDLKSGDRVYVNGTECKVLLVTERQFVARAVGRTKQAWFDRSTGIGVHNPHYKATTNLF